MPTDETPDSKDSDSADAPAESAVAPESAIASEAGAGPSWHALLADEVVSTLETNVATGLAAADIPARHERHGFNRLPEPPPPSLWKLIFDQIADVTVLALIGAAIIALTIALVQGVGSTLEKYGDTGAIMGIVVLNAVLGILQQKRADRALSALKELTAPTAQLLRDGQVIEVPSGEVVPGDILVLETGDRVAADARLITTAELLAQEGALTGESAAVEKDPNAEVSVDAPLAERPTMIYAGTVIVAGKGVAVVTGTGLHSEVGKIAAMVQQAETPATPLEKDLHKFGILVVIGCVAASTVVFGIGAIQGGQSMRELFLIAVSLAVAAIPEGLPAITTIVLALGTHAMAKRGALVRRLHAVETLGCTQVLCTDKTGTLTRNQMKVVRLAVGETIWEAEDDKTIPEHLLDGAEVAAGARGKAPTDLALLKVGRQLGSSIADAEMVDEVPFASERRMATTVFRDGDGFFVSTRGAFERVLEHCAHIVGADGEDKPLTEGDRARIAERAEAWAGDAMRVIALARRFVPAKPEQGWESELTFVGLAGITDPIRPEVKGAVARALQAGIRVMMITGDHPTTARAIAVQSGILTAGGEVVTGLQLGRMDDEELDGRLPHLSVVARATAADKMRIITALKRRGEVAGMTGDGVNDAPALKSADIGVAMGKTGTDVAREASAMVLADDNFATIVAAISEGRAIYSNIRRFITFLFASNAGLVFAVTIASLLGWSQPMAPIQILWINLITNGLPALALGLEPSLEDRMAQPPRAPNEPILRWSDALRISVVGMLMAGGGLWAFYEATGGNPGVSNPAARSAAFTVFAVAPLFYAFSARSDHTPLWRLGALSNSLLVGAVLIGAGLQAIAVFLPGTRVLFRTGPMTGADWGRVLLASAVPFVLVEVWKVVGGRRT
ncbi:MAG: cation-translocating P-type ATPase [bacterium]